MLWINSFSSSTKPGRLPLLFNIISHLESVFSRRTPSQLRRYQWDQRITLGNTSWTQNIEYVSHYFNDVASSRPERKYKKKSSACEQLIWLVILLSARWHDTSFILKKKNSFLSVIWPGHVTLFSWTLNNMFSNSKFTKQSSYFFICVYLTYDDIFLRFSHWIWSGF